LRVAPFSGWRLSAIRAASSTGQVTGVDGDAIVKTGVDDDPGDDTPPGVSDEQAARASSRAGPPRAARPSRPRKERRSSGRGRRRESSSGTGTASLEPTLTRWQHGCID